MTELSLNVLDIAQNSIKANATLITIEITVNTVKDFLKITIEDNGCGMPAEKLENVTDPFFTTRTTRKVGLGIPFFKMAAEQTGGNFKITSKVGVGTIISAAFILSNIDRMPLGDICETIRMLIVFNTGIDFTYIYTVDDDGFTLSTDEMKVILDGIPLDSPEINAYIKDFLAENTQMVNKGRNF